MKVTKISDAEAKPDANDLFTGGTVKRQWLVDDKMSEGLRVMVVHFSPGARTKFHTHTFEQVLLATEGKGVVATETEEYTLTPGTIAYIPAGENHWHGATQDTSFAHLAIATPGKTSF
jgi:quercetin dioxygenase-like cupin family protein